MHIYYECVFFSDRFLLAALMPLSTGRCLRLTCASVIVGSHRYFPPFPKGWAYCGLAIATLFSKRHLELLAVCLKATRQNLDEKVCDQNLATVRQKDKTMGGLVRTLPRRLSRSLVFGRGFVGVWLVQGYEPIPGQKVQQFEFCTQVPAEGLKS